MKKTRRPPRGFTLVEVIVALMIILLSVGGIFAGFIAAARFVRDAKDRITAVNFARLKFEELRSEVRQDTWDVSGTPLYDNPAISGGTSYGPFNYNVSNFNYNVTYTVTADAGNDWRAVSMRTRWDVSQ